MFPQPLAVDGQATFDPVTRSLLVRVAGFGGTYWRRGHAKLVAAQVTGDYRVYLNAPPEVRANGGACGEPLQGGWMRFKVDDATYRQLAGDGLSAIVTVDQAQPRILGVKFRRRS